MIRPHYWAGALTLVCAYCLATASHADRSSQSGEESSRPWWRDYNYPIDRRINDAVTLATENLELALDSVESAPANNPILRRSLRAASILSRGITEYNRWQDFDSDLESQNYWGATEHAALGIMHGAIDGLLRNAPGSGLVHVFADHAVYGLADVLSAVGIGDYFAGIDPDVLRAEANRMEAETRQLQAESDRITVDARRPTHIGQEPASPLARSNFRLPVTAFPKSVSNPDVSAEPTKHTLEHLARQSAPKGTRYAVDAQGSEPFVRATADRLASALRDAFAKTAIAAEEQIDVLNAPSTLKPRIEAERWLIDPEKLYIAQKWLDYQLPEDVSRILDMSRYPMRDADPVVWDTQGALYGRPGGGNVPNPEYIHLKKEIMSDFARELGRLSSDNNINNTLFENYYSWIRDTDWTLTLDVADLQWYLLVIMPETGSVVWQGSGRMHGAGPFYRLETTSVEFGGDLAPSLERFYAFDAIDCRDPLSPRAALSGSIADDQVKSFHVPLFFRRINP